MAIATNYSFMRNSGKTPRFEEAFAFKHILNAEDSALFLRDARPLDKKGERITSGLITNTDRAYTQAMNRFNTPGVTAAAVTILEATANPPMPVWEDKNGVRTYHLPVDRGWKFTRVDNDGKAPNHTKYEAVLTAQFTSPRRAKLSCMQTQGVVNHWDQAENLAWFG